MGIDDSQLNYYLEQLNLLLPQMHLQWLNNTKASFDLIDVNPVGGSYQVLAQAATQEQMVERNYQKLSILRICQSLLSFWEEREREVRLSCGLLLLLLSAY